MSQVMQTIVFRHEQKYICDAKQNAVLKAKINMLMRNDPHTDQYGAYHIRSLYFDNFESNCFYENESGVGDRDKYRIRIYNSNTAKITLEKKSKVRGMTRKISCNINQEQCHQLMRGYFPQIEESMEDKLKDILLEMQQKIMRPVVIVEYLRFPYIEKAGNVRIT